MKKTTFIAFCLIGLLLFFAFFPVFWCFIKVLQTTPVVYPKQQAAEVLTKALEPYDYDVKCSAIEDVCKWYGIEKPYLHEEELETLAAQKEAAKSTIELNNQLTEALKMLAPVNKKGEKECTK